MKYKIFFSVIAGFLVTLFLASCSFHSINMSGTAPKSSNNKLSANAQEPSWPSWQPWFKGITLDWGQGTLLLPNRTPQSDSSYLVHSQVTFHFPSLTKQGVTTYNAKIIYYQTANPLQNVVKDITVTNSTVDITVPLQLAYTYHIAFMSSSQRPQETHIPFKVTYDTPLLVNYQNCQASVPQNINNQLTTYTCQVNPGEKASMIGAIGGEFNNPAHDYTFVATHVNPLKEQGAIVYAFSTGQTVPSEYTTLSYGKIHSQQGVKSYIPAQGLIFKNLGQYPVDLVIQFFVKNAH